MYVCVVPELFLKCFGTPATFGAWVLFYVPRIRRYCDPKYKTQVKASKEVLQLYNTDEGRLMSPIHSMWTCKCHLFPIF